MNKKYNNRQVGTSYEELAIKYLEGKDYKILARNFRCYIGEIDIIALNKDYLTFIEVKYRKNSSSGYAIDSVTKTKQRTIFKVARFFMIKNKIPENTPCCFDIIAIDGNKISHTKNAFGGM